MAVDKLKPGTLIRAVQGGDYVVVGKTAEGKLIVRPLILGKPMQVNPDFFQP